MEAKTSLRVHKSTWGAHREGSAVCVWNMSSDSVSAKQHWYKSQDSTLHCTYNICAKMQKSIWSASNEVLKYNSIRPDHPVQIVDNVVKFLKQKYKVEILIKLLNQFRKQYFQGRNEDVCGCGMWHWDEHQEFVWEVQQSLRKLWKCGKLVQYYIHITITYI